MRGWKSCSANFLLNRRALGLFPPRLRAVTSGERSSRPDRGGEVFRNPLPELPRLQHAECLPRKAPREVSCPLLALRSERGCEVRSNANSSGAETRSCLQVSVLSPRLITGGGNLPPPAPPPRTLCLPRVFQAAPTTRAPGSRSPPQASHGLQDIPSLIPHAALRAGPFPSLRRNRPHVLHLGTDAHEPIISTWKTH